MSFRSFLWSTFLVGLLSFGGGKAFIPVYQKLYVDTYHLITPSMLHEYIGYALIFPGPISPIITGLVGFFSFGILGLILGILLLTLPPILLVYFTYLTLSRYRNTKSFSFVSLYLQAAVLSLLVFVAWEFLQPYTREFFSIKPRILLGFEIFFLGFAIFGLLNPSLKNSLLHRFSFLCFLSASGILLYTGLHFPLYQKPCIFLLILFVSFWTVMKYSIHPIWIILFAIATGLIFV